MEVAAHPDHGCRIERGVPRPVLPKEMALAAEEGEGTLSHRLVLHVEALGVTPLVEAQDAGCDGAGGVVPPRWSPNRRGPLDERFAHHADVSATSEGHHRRPAL